MTSGWVYSLSNSQPARSGQLAAVASAPLATPQEHHSQQHGITLTDPWHWLRDPSYPKVETREIIDYLQAENAYYQAVMTPHSAFVDALAAELRGRQPEDDVGVPFRDGDWWYQWRFAAENQYKTWYRRPHSQQDSAEGQTDWQCFLDEERLAAGCPNFILGGWRCSPDGRYLAWSADTEGAERFTLLIKDLATGRLLDEPISNTLSAPLWSARADLLLYVVLNDQWRPYQVRAHQIGTPVTQDIVLYEEKSEGFWVSIFATQSKKWLVLCAKDHETSELWLLASDHPLADPVLVAPRKTGHRYDLDHANERFWICTNDNHRNFRLVSSPEATPTAAYWREEIAPSVDRYLTQVKTFQHFYVVTGRANGLDYIQVRTYDGDKHDVAWPEPIYEAALDVNMQFAIDRLRLRYSSLVTPATVFDYAVDTRRLERLKVQAIPSGYDADLYQCERIFVKVRDAVAVPVSLVYRKDVRKNGSAPLYLYGYGAYGHVVAPGFSSAWLSLLDRGYICALAHVRGGADMGHQWYEDGKLLRRTNSFNDFVDVAKHLIQSGYSSQGRIVALGGSAGGGLMGAVLNEAPELWGAVVAHVPFVDVLNTMLDASLPLTPMEWPEWGNPIIDRVAFDCIQSYSPYDQVKAQRYPPMLVTAGLNDPRVTYWEPAKWVARLRSLKTDNNLLLFRTNMDAGHQGQSGRYHHLYEQAETWAFILLAMATAGDDAKISPSKQR